ncbi:hypothetical protein AMTRI_Chr09g14410 [Amborella trichopoda]|uniref:Uncharacterized protein n=1 Tax=Amborella trichopoda TaxID=13333 RepID=W1NK36_AMBTC|nr:uncharacterized protein LOC18424059 [Amborella trichopoda]ERM96152.1 hypothetical protein AMTR_s00001p00049640 [Amborella trichopoda]|eukprot:XP_006828736.1 uncharacterized protein LOC18424059 [Amborella trichopoda]
MAGSSATSFLKNQYWVLRHGRSIPNERGIIISNRVYGILPQYGLSSKGVQQAASAGESFLRELKAKNIPLENVRICYSPFSRTIHTAQVVARVMNLPFDGPQFKVIEDLRERKFGPTFELQSHDKYPEIWDLDEKDPFLPPEGGESVANVASRLANALATIEAEFDGCVVLVVSHGDPLQILQTVIHTAMQETNGSKDIPSIINGVTTHSTLSQHRKFALATGELRLVT